MNRRDVIPQFLRIHKRDLLIGEIQSQLYPSHLLLETISQRDDLFGQGTPHVTIGQTQTSLRLGLYDIGHGFRLSEVYPPA